MALLRTTQWRERVRRQTLALIEKNFLLFLRSPWATLFRALILPIFFTAIICSGGKFSNAGSTSEAGGIADSSQQIKSLKQALDDVPLTKLVLCTNGLNGTELNPIIETAVQGISLDRWFITDEVDDLYYDCRQSLTGISNCFAAVIFTSINATNVDYIIATDSAKSLFSTDFAKHESLSNDRLMPLQWAIDSSIGSFSKTTPPSELPWSGRFGGQSSDSSSFDATSWFMVIYYFVAPAFLLALIGVVYHVSLFVASERELGMTELLDAQTCTKTPRIFSTIASFVAIYSPGWIVCSILMTQLLFTRCSDVILLFLTLLAGTSLTVWSMFLSSLFRKAQLAGLYASILTFTLAFCTVAFVFSDTPAYTMISILSIIFPPYTYSTLIADIARAEDRLASFSLLKFTVSTTATSDSQRLAPQVTGYLYIVFFFAQIAIYTAACFAVEHYKWSVKRTYDEIDSSSDIAVRCTELSKTFQASRRWYWPWSTVGTSHLAVNSLNLELKTGSVNFLLGPNGGGKTTTLKCIAGIIPADKTSRLEINQNATFSGVCPSIMVFWERLTVAEHVRIWRKIKTGTHAVGGEDDVLMECDILSKSNQAPETLSGGQQRKLQLAIAFVGGSTMCFIDEASSGLDPLSRRNIWNIISNSHSRRTILITTHFLDEADILADNISIIYKGGLVCTGTPTSLKSNYGLNLEIRQVATENDEGYEEEEEDEENKMPTWTVKTSTEATKKILELEELSGGLYSVTFPTLEQVFLNVTNSSLIDGNGNGDATSSDQISRQDTELEELNAGNVEGITLEVGKQTTLSHQILAILKKRYLLTRRSWMGYGIALAIPIIIAGALAGEFAKFNTFDPCTHRMDVTMRNASIEEAMSLRDSLGTFDVIGPLDSPDFYSAEDLAYYKISSVAGPPAAFDGEVQNTIYVENMGQYFSPFELEREGITGEQKALATRGSASSLTDMVTIIKDNHGEPAFGVFAADSADITLVHRMSPEYSMAGMNIIANRLANSSAQTGTARQIKTSFRKFRRVKFEPDSLSIPLLVFVTLGLICSTSVSIMYPVFERINNVRALQYSNSVSSAALWMAYLIFDMHIGLITSVVTWAIIFAGGNSRIWYESTFILFAMLLFCIATYLGLYICSLFLRKAAFAVAVGVHIMLMLVYLIAYVINDSKEPLNSYDITVDIQGVLGLTSPAANLLRTFFVATDNFGITCGETGWYDLHPIAFQLYGGVYINLILQIMFCALVLAYIETGSSAWFSKFLPKRKMPATQAQLDFGMEGRESPNFAPEQDGDIPLKPLKGKTSIPVLVVSKITKFFKSLLAVQEISLSISTNETLALLGANGAGKTTTINMIRGLITPNHGTITIDGINVLASPQQARIHTGVCPQDDAIDELTVRQTLSFYASIKGLRDVKANVDGVMRAFGITSFADRLITKLSGGTRRKVMVAIAILGNPRLLLLDEPSTGQDAGAKRVLWKILRSLSNDRAILITTHSMEETEALATKVAIVDKKMLASGTTSQLRSRFGGFYRLRAAYEVGSEMELEAALGVMFGTQVRNLKCAFGEVEFELPYERKMIGRIMLSMESLMVSKEGVLGIERTMSGQGLSENSTRDMPKMLRDYTILEPSMDDVFLNVCKEAEIGIL
ncbi:ABC transporter [Botrytis cinerea]